jgi:hypothetical protein
MKKTRSRKSRDTVPLTFLCGKERGIMNTLDICSALLTKRYFCKNKRTFNNNVMDVAGICILLLYLFIFTLCLHQSLHSEEVISNLKPFLSK